jgi:hypothetical protein
MLLVMMPTKLSVMKVQTGKYAPDVIVPAPRRDRMKRAEDHAELCQH